MPGTILGSGNTAEEKDTKPLTLEELKHSRNIQVINKQKYMVRKMAK